MEMAPKETFYGFIDKYHADRRAKLLKAHPEVRGFMRIDPSFKFVAAACACTQILVAYQLRSAALWQVVLMALGVGTLFDCAVCNSMHETVHDLAIKGSAFANKVFGTFVNFALVWPACGGYYRTHRHHHAYLGTNLDAKYPSVEEALQYDFSVWDRLRFIFSHPLSFGERWNKNVPEPPTDFMIWNKRAVYLWDFVFFLVAGYKPLLYLLIAFWVNDCVFVQGSKNFADHWVDDSGQPITTSNYGHFNKINFNIGYHREHHDLPNIPGRYLKSVNKVAPEQYADEKYIAKSLFGDVWTMLRAEYGKGILKHANKAPIPKTKVN